MKKESGTPVLLIIDDEEMICEALETMVNGLTRKVRVITANSAEEGALLIPGADMIIADIRMKDRKILDEALQKVTGRIPIARMSGSESEVTNFMMEKPFDLRKVAETLQFLYRFRQKAPDRAA
jgi:DNA-binding NtrC family response regulator